VVQSERRQNELFACDVVRSETRGNEDLGPNRKSGLSGMPVEDRFNIWRWESKTFGAIRGSPEALDAKSRRRI